MICFSVASVMFTVVGVWSVGGIQACPLFRIIAGGHAKQKKIKILGNLFLLCASNIFSINWLMLFVFVAFIL